MKVAENIYPTLGGNERSNLFCTILLFTTISVSNKNVFFYAIAFAAHSKVRAFLTDGGQINVEDAIQHKVPVVGISYSTSYDHYLRQIVKYEAGIISLIDFETQTFVDKLQDVLINER